MKFACPTFALTALASLAMLLAACAPTAPAGARRDEPSAATSAPRVLKLGIASDAEPKEFGLAFGSLSAGASEPRFMLHAPLTYFDDSATLQPRIAERVPTIENGDWLLLPDGRMEVTWKLRPDVRWHDGTPLSADDVVLGYRIAIDPELALGTGVLRQIADVTAPDPSTLVVRWRNTYIYANAMGLETLVPIPRHRFAPLYEAGDKQAFANSPYWAEEWIGLGPYKMRDWLRGSYIEAEAYDGYFLGRPKIDRVSIRYLGDTRALLVAIMAGDVDVVPVGSLKEEEAHVLKTQWEATGAGSVSLSNNKLRHGDWQWRDSTAPWAQDVRVRQALLHLIDRQSLVDTIQNGLSSVDNIALPRQDPAYRLAQQRGLPSLGFDPALAHRLFAEAGLIRGADGAYRTQAGQPFAIELSATGDINSNVQEMLAIESQWKTAGLEPSNVIITGAMDKDQVRGRLQGLNLTSSDLSYRYFQGYITSEIRSEATRWRGANIGGYTNPAFDQLYTRLFSTINGPERDEIAAGMVKIVLDQMLFLPLSYSSDVSTAKKEVRGVTGVLPTQRVTAWNVHLWEMR